MSTKHAASAAARLFDKSRRIKPEDLITSWRVLKGDKVEVISGRDFGKQGLVKKVVRKENSVIVEGVNIVKKHVKGSKEQQGGIFPVENKIHVSNVQVVDPATGRPSRTAFRFLEDGSKVRVAKASGAIIPKPAACFRKVPRSSLDSPTDTTAEVLKGIMLQPDITKKLLQELQQLQVDEPEVSSEEGNISAQNKA
jgi:large subunit ribosomal protein L24